MKKIVAILMVLALVAGAFAAEVSAKVRLDGDLFNYNVDSGDMKAIMIGHKGDQDWNPVIATSIEDDNYGASVSFFVGNWGPAGNWNEGYFINANQWNIWFKPADILKFSIGRISAASNTDTIDWDRHLSNYDEWGYQAIFEINALTINLGLHQGAGAYWMAGSDFNGLGVFTNYALDNGSITFSVNAENSFDDIAAVFGYKGAFGELGMFVDAAVFYNPAKVGFGADFDISYAADAFGFEAYVAYTDKGASALDVLTQATFNVDPVTVYLYFKDENALADVFASEIKLGVNGSVGDVSWDVAADFNTGSKVFSIPVKFVVSF